MSTTSNLTNSIRARYLNDYIMGAERRRVYDILCYPIVEDRDKLQRNSSIVVPFLSKMAPGETAISETVDITPQTLRDATATLTPSSRGEAIQDSEKLLLQNYTEYAGKRFAIIGENMMESVEAYSLTKILAGSNVQRTVARASLDAGTASHRLNYLQLRQMQNRLSGLRCPDMDEQGVVQGYYAILHPDALYDLETASPISTISQYVRPEIVLNPNEIGMLAGFRLIVSPWAKVFGGAGADNSSNADTTLSNAEYQLDTVVTVASASNLSSGTWLTIGTEETGSTYYPGNERVKYVSESSTDITVVGGGDNGGLAYDHASGVAVRNADSVYPVICGGPRSVAKAYASDMENGEFGTVVGPLKQGLAEQWVSLAWKWYGGYAIISENWLGRIEVSSSMDA